MIGYVSIWSQSSRLHQLEGTTQHSSSSSSSISDSIALRLDRSVSSPAERTLWPSLGKASQLGACNPLFAMAATKRILQQLHAPTGVLKSSIESRWEVTMYSTESLS